MFEEIYKGFMDDLKKRFPNCPIEKSYPVSGKIENVPIIIVECTEFYPTRDGIPNDGAKEFVTRWEIRHMLSKMQEHDAEFAARDIAMAIAVMFSDRVFTDYTYPAECLGATDDNMDFSMPNESWVTEFSIRVRAGELADKEMIGYGEVV